MADSPKVRMVTSAVVNSVSRLQRERGLERETIVEAMCDATAILAIELFDGDHRQAADLFSEVANTMRSFAANDG